MDESDDPFGMPAFDMTERLAARNGRTDRRRLGAGTGRPGEFMTAEGVPFYEVIEVELEGLE